MTTKEDPRYALATAYMKERDRLIDQLVTLNAQDTQFAIFDDADIRIQMIDGEPWFVAKDVCEVLGIQNVSQAVASLDSDEKGISNIYTLGGEQGVLTVNESGLYFLIFKSKKEVAKAFRKWVTSTVLPTIRRTGGYLLNEENLDAELQHLLHQDRLATVKQFIAYKYMHMIDDVLL